MLNFFIGFAFFEAGAFFGFFVAALMQAARSDEIELNGKEDSHGREHSVGAENCAGSASVIWWNWLRPMFTMPNTSSGASPICLSCRKSGSIWCLPARKNSSVS